MTWFRPFKKYALCFSLSCVVCYFLYHMIEGERGLRAWDRLSRQLSSSQSQLALLEKQQAILEQNISLLGNQLDLDLLEQQVREFLHYSHPREQILFWEKEEAARLPQR